MKMAESTVGHSEVKDEDWRDLALQIQHETDAKKMMELVGQLIAKLDGENAKKPVRTDPPPAFTDRPEADS